MANEIARENVFKYVALRPPVLATRERRRLGFVADARKADESPVVALVNRLASAGGAGGSTDIVEMIQKRKFDPQFPQSDGNLELDKIRDQVRLIAPDAVTTLSLDAAVRSASGLSAVQFWADKSRRELLHNIWDRYYAFYVSRSINANDLGTLTQNLRVFHLIELLADNAAIVDAKALTEILSAIPIVPPVFGRLQEARPSAEEPRAEKLPQKTAQQYEDLWKNFVETQQALDQVRDLRFVFDSKTETDDVEQLNTVSGLTETASVTTMSSRAAIDPSSFKALHRRSRELLASIGQSQDALDLPKATNKLKDRLRQAYYELSQVKDARLLDLMPDEAKRMPGLYQIRAKLSDDRRTIPEGRLDDVPDLVRPSGENVLASIKPLGIGDLKVVKQKLKKYAAGEVSHIENVLRGEYKERKYRVLDRTEQTFTTSSETENEETKDNQTTERFELKKESEKTLQDQMSVQAGITISGSYGMVTFGAYGDFAYSTSSEESNKSSSNFAREVVDKSVSRIQTKTKEERISKTLHEVEEIDTHGIDNKDKPDHVTGIYRWVDKYYEAQIYNYGKRMMFEFIIPEPAAFLEYAQANKPKKDITPPKPIEESITHLDITELNYQDYIRDYQVQGCTPPPPEYVVISTTLASEAQIIIGTPLSKSSKDLIVPAGYKTTDISFSGSFYWQNFPEVHLSIGNDNAWYTFSRHKPGGVSRRDPVIGSISAYDGVVPISLNLYDVVSYYVNVSVVCQRGWEKYESWQILTFEKIMTAYQALLATYEQKVAQQEVQAGIVIQGQNPLINREIEKNELKKSCIKLLMSTNQFGSFNAMKQPTGKAPDFDIKDAVREGPTIQFFEQAFEWENLVYLLYPYFWARKSEWIHKVNTYDTDPLFTKFLQAGSSRVVVPVHPGYNDAMLYFLEHNGAIWNGGSTPRLDDPLFISIADELRDQTDDLGGAIPDGEPWEVVLPTTLVYLQQDATLPTFP